MLVDIFPLLYPTEIEVILDSDLDENVNIDDKYLTKLKQEYLSSIEHVQAGVYVGGLNLNHSIKYLIKEEYPEDLGIHCYGVCDAPEQVLWKSNIVRAERIFVVLCSSIEKDPNNAGLGGGWRWHKWGPYIGEQDGPTREYLDDEPNIDLVYTYHILQLDPLTLYKAQRLLREGKLISLSFCKYHHKDDLCAIKE